MRNSDTTQNESVPCKVLVCLRVAAEKNLVVVGQKVEDKAQPHALIFTSVRKGPTEYLGLLESDNRTRVSPLDLARNLVQFEAALLLPPERFKRDTGWITSEGGESVWLYLYFVDIDEGERNSLLLDLPNRKTFRQMNLEEARNFVPSVGYGHFLRLQHSHWFGEHHMQRAA